MNPQNAAWVNSSTRPSLKEYNAAGMFQGSSRPELTFLLPVCGVGFLVTIDLSWRHYARHVS